jgi:shikimate dehydrogenase
MGIPYAEVIGDPIDHSKSPLIHKFWLERLGIEGDYRAVRVGTKELPAYFEERRQDPNWRGCNVTIPHKEMAVSFADRLTHGPRAAGALNVLARKPDGLIGYNTDMEALHQLLSGYAREAGLLGHSLIVFGAGGAARAVLAVLRDEGEDIDLAIFNRDVDKANAVLAKLGLKGSAHPLTDPLPAAGLVVNASSLGMTGFPALPRHLTEVSSPVIELVYSPVETELVKAARARGYAVVDGLSVLIGQAALAFRHFFGIAPPFETEVELRGLLAS